MNYEEMSDFGLSEMYLKVKYGDDAMILPFSQSSEAAVAYVKRDNGELVAEEIFDLNNPADAWPIIVENEIGVNKLKCEPYWMAEKGDFYARDRNPLAACMIVYLMMHSSDH